jgi:hypothetical protein
VLVLVLVLVLAQNNGCSPGTYRVINNAVVQEKVLKCREDVQINANALLQTWQAFSDGNINCEIGDNIVCTGCQPGFFQANHDQLGCIACTAGKYTDTALSRQCRYVMNVTVVQLKS